MYKYILDMKEADLLWEAGALYVANQGKNNWQLDTTRTPPSISWSYDYAVLLEE